jgi:hypothetical protein
MRARSAITLLAFLATQFAFAKPPEKQKDDDGFVAPYQFGMDADFTVSCEGLNHPPYVDVPPELTPFVPNGTQPIEWRKGDLNLDKRLDYILVVEKDCDERTMMIIVRKADGSLFVAASNDHILVDRSDGINDYDGTTVYAGGFTINGHETASNLPPWSLTFAWSAKQHTWLLKESEQTGCDKGECSTTTDTTAAGTPFESYRID